MNHLNKNNRLNINSVHFLIISEIINTRSQRKKDNFWHGGCFDFFTTQSAMKMRFCYFQEISAVYSLVC